MRTMRAGEFKARCLKVMDQIQKTREPLIVTKRGKPVVKLFPADKAGSRRLWLPQGRRQDRGRC